ncbi:zinc finger-containing ubiquitin peptidase 1-like [Liolophura sinensis]|uniref:zinc finger-containing ubiquitin peptidase 1-like n=1 Tax=Liolophura sinensis TaxID=3198878 RepID=UPI0031586D1C
MAEGGIPSCFNCVICGQDGLSEQEMRTHVLLEHVEASVCCPFCDIHGGSVEEIEDHMYMEHLELLSPNKRQSSDGEADNPRSDSSSSRDKSSFKKGKKAPYVNLEYFNKSLVDITKDGGKLFSGSKGQVMPVVHRRSDCEWDSGQNVVAHDLSDTVMAESSVLERTEFINAETGEKMYKLPVVHVMSNPDSQLPQNKMSSLASKRARLSLDVSPCSKNSPPKPTGDTSSSTSSGSDFHCPLCKFTTSSEAEIQRHVNVSHLDVLSPAKPSGSGSMEGPGFSQMENGASADSDQFMEIVPEGEPIPSTSHLDFECPICNMHLDSSLSLELHVNSKHSDVLSPDVPASESDSVLAEATTSCAMDDDTLCPVCNVHIPDPVTMTAHVEGHFSSEQIPGSSEDRDVACQIQAKELANQLTGDAAMAADLVNRELMDEILAKDIAEKEQSEQLDEQKQFEKLQAQFGMDNKNNYKKQYELNLERAVCKGQISMNEFYSHKTSLVHSGVNGIDDGHSCTKGVIDQLHQFYEKLPANVSGVWLCSEADHYAASHGDKGWGCGYRNLQMLLSSLATDDTYQKILFNGRPLIPSIPKIQRLIETAWQKGFDVQGAEQLGGKLVNTSKWIGATEITATLLSLRVRCELLDFHTPTGPAGTHPQMLTWVRDYFMRSAPHKPPLYLQHQGHSRTIVGIEELKDGCLRPLLFDPSCSKRQMEQLKGEVTANHLRMLRRTIQGLKAKQYQIVAVMGILEEDHYENSKVIRSQRIP